MPAPDFNRLRRTAACALVFDADRRRLLLHRRTDRTGNGVITGFRGYLAKELENQ